MSCPLDFVLSAGCRIKCIQKYWTHALWLKAWKRHVGGSCASAPQDQDHRFWDIDDLLKPNVVLKFRHYGGGELYRDLTSLLCWCVFAVFTSLYIGSTSFKLEWENLSYKHSHLNTLIVVGYCLPLPREFLVDTLSNILIVVLKAYKHNYLMLCVLPRIHQRSSAVSPHEGWRFSCGTSGTCHPNY